MDPGATLDTIDLDLPDHTSGKVREAWRLPDDRRLLVTTDRISAFDRVLGTVQHKGQVLNQIAAWWFNRTRDIVANHVIDVPDPNALIAVDADPLPVEVVVRGRLTGSTSTSLLPRYEAGDRLLYGYRLPDDLTAHGPLPEPLITPTTKATEGGHDQPITCDEVVELGLVEVGLWAQVQKAALDLFERGTTVAADAGFILADTKYEFGLAPGGELLLIDEVHTPDSSRFWAAETMEDRLAAGLAPESFDKEPVRLALKAAGYGGDGPPPDLDPRVLADTTARYVDFYQRLTGSTFEPGAQPIFDRLRANLEPVLNA
ncbi:MAG: phosphoribosylaminoimidazolesuccinocarboxamide synthase [Acidimicrobiia bacterium]|nr:phosphoribosylaminoimidazolesuccinocarboxamide synthase [Acidimicrobiia bacterium]